MSTTTNIPKSARAAVLTNFGKPYDIQEFPVKEPSDLAIGECLIKMEYAGCCHSDLHVRDNDWGFPPQLPLVGGHEGIGRVVAIGEHTQTSVKVGDRVGLKWIARSCLRCDLCRRGKESACPFQRSHGFSDHGTFSEYCLSYTDYVTPIPESLDSAAATPILCAGITVYKALKETKAIIGEWVAITGAGGGLGHLAVQYAVAMGFRVIAIDTGSSKKELCHKLGAEKWIDFMESKDLIEEVQRMTGGLGPHAAVIAVGSATPFNQALMYLRPSGTLVCVGVPSAGAMLNVPLNMFVPKCLTIVGTATGNRQDMAEALDIVASGKVKCHYEVKPLDEVNNVMEDMHKGKLTGRIVLKIQ
ncbi:GroES-like protein [Marasmius fiardii PR-910]|nr:GroES-like protein [Marasmius fiardii PR-910]